jgi:hypothetical protein
MTESAVEELEDSGCFVLVVVALRILRRKIWGRYLEGTDRLCISAHGYSTFLGRMNSYVESYEWYTYGSLVP